MRCLEVKGVLSFAPRFKDGGSLRVSSDEKGTKV